MLRLRTGDKVKVTDETRATYYENPNHYKNGDILEVLRINSNSNGVIYVGNYGDDWLEDKHCFDIGGLELLEIN